MAGAARKFTCSHWRWFIPIGSSKQRDRFSLLSHISLFFSWLLWRLVDLSRSSTLAGSVSLLRYHAGESQLRKKGPFLPACPHACRPDPPACPHSSLLPLNSLYK